MAARPHQLCLRLGWGINGQGAGLEKETISERAALV